MKITVYAKVGCALCDSIFHSLESYATKGVLKATVMKVTFPNWAKRDDPSPDFEEKMRLCDATAEMIMQEMYDTPALGVFADDGSFIWGVGHIMTLKDIPFAIILRASTGSEKDLAELRRRKKQ